MSIHPFAYTRNHPVKCFAYFSMGFVAFFTFGISLCLILVTLFFHFLVIFICPMFVSFSQRAKTFGQCPCYRITTFEKRVTCVICNPQPCALKERYPLHRTHSECLLSAKMGHVSYVNCLHARRRQVLHSSNTVEMDRHEEQPVRMGSPSRNSRGFFASDPTGHLARPHSLASRSGSLSSASSSGKNSVSSTCCNVGANSPASCVLGVCAMDIKARSKAMREILTRLRERSRGAIDVKVFGDKVILDEGQVFALQLSLHCSPAHVHRAYNIYIIHIQTSKTGRDAIFSFRSSVKTFRCGRLCRMLGCAARFASMICPRSRSCGTDGWWAPFWTS